MPCPDRTQSGSPEAEAASGWRLHRPRARSDLDMIVTAPHSEGPSQLSTLHSGLTGVEVCEVLSAH